MLLGAAPSVSSHICAASLALIAACTPVATPPLDTRGVPEPAQTAARPSIGLVAAPTNQPHTTASGLFAGITLTGDPALVAAALAQRWCERGGDSFRAPAQGPVADDEAYPPRLDSCADVKVKQHRRDEAEGLRATLFSLDASWEARELLLLQTAEHASLVELERRREDESGEAGTVWREHVDIELRDVTGTPRPEWIAKIRVWGGDSYEADHCHAHTYESRALVVCSENEAGFSCLREPYLSLHLSEPRPEAQREDHCGPAAEHEPPSTTGWAMTATVRREVVVFAIDTSVKLDGAEPGDADRTVRLGEVPLARLFTDAVLPVDVFE